MDIALNTDYLTSRKSPEKYLRLAAEAGFTHLHWCHQWNTDYLYSTWEIAQYKAWLKQYGLALLDIHGSAGQEKCWYSPVEYERRSGVLLVLNRIIMQNELEGTGCIMMHAPVFHTRSMTQEAREVVQTQFEALKRSLDELCPYLEKYKTRIAIENVPNDDFSIIAQVMESYPDELLGITLDSGHAHMGDARGLDFMEQHTGRLQALHLHDNNGSADQHQPPFYGTLDWERVARLVANSSYASSGRPISFELSMRNTPFFEAELETEQNEKNIRSFLSDAAERCRRVDRMYREACRKNINGL